MVSPSNLTIKFLCSYGGKILPRYPDGKLRYHGGETRVLAVHRSIPFSELLVKLGEMCGTTSVLSLRCQLPTEDLDALISITSDEDLANLIEEYDRAAAGILNSTTHHKIRAFLSNPNNNNNNNPTNYHKHSPTATKSSPSQPPSSSIYYPTPKSFLSSSSPVPTLMTKISSCNRVCTILPTAGGGGRCVHQMAAGRRYPMMKLIPKPFQYINYNYEKGVGRIPHHHHQYAYCTNTTTTSTPAARKTGHVYLIHHGNHWQ